mmetsp:Transcript_32398/g.78419  ORF Transcript_32398/g.78419 Transcript_32398/m.78419 type:complete len:104 (+) Transcript_32398:88-399(+)
MISTSARHGPDRPPHDQNMTPQDSQPTKTLLGGHRTLLPLRNQVFDRARWSDLTVDLLASIFLMMDDDDDENMRTACDVPSSPPSEKYWHCRPSHASATACDC